MSAAFGRDFSQVRVHGDSRPVVRRYVAYSSAAQQAGLSNGWAHPGGFPLRVADDGNAAVEDRGWNPNTNKRAWTTPNKILDANGRLAAQGSQVMLLMSGGQGLSGQVPGSPVTHNLVEITPARQGGGPFTLATDCGDAAREVMGSGGGRDVAVLNRGTSERYLTPRTYHGGAPTTPEEWSEELFRALPGGGPSRAAAYNAYANLPPAHRDMFDQAAGINTYATPRVGQGLTVSTERSMPGFATFIGIPAWNFHYAATVLTSGHDYVTLENAAGWQHTDWIFYMYGPRTLNQTFHQQHGAMGTHGTHGTTFVVQPEHLLYVYSWGNGRFQPQSGFIQLLPLNTPLRVIERRLAADGTPYYWVLDQLGQYGSIRVADVR
jgi:hypothetical protein